LRRKTCETIERLYPKKPGDGASKRTEHSAKHLVPSDFDLEARSFCAAASGYIQHIDVDGLIKFAAEHDLLIRVGTRPGRFVTDRTTVFAVYPGGRVSDDVAEGLRRTFFVGKERTPEQDLEFSIRRIVEIAQRALSPGVNDPTTAMYCIDRLGEALVRLAGRDIHSSARFDEKRRLRVLTEVISLQEISCTAFAAIARYGLGDADVVSRLLETMDLLARAASAGATRIY